MSQTPPLPNYTPPPPKKGLSTGAIIAIVAGGLVLIIVPLLACMIGLLLPAMGQARQAARNAMSMSQMRQISIALQQYAGDNQGNLPEAGADLKLRLAPYGLTAAEFTAPSPPPTGESYYYVPLGNLNNLSSPGTAIILYESPAVPSRSGWNVAYADGSVQAMRDPQYAQLLAGLKLPDGTPWAPHMGK